MKYLNLTKSLAIIAFVSLAFTACDKPSVSTPMGDAGQTLVKILDGGTPASLTKKPIDFVSTTFTMLGLEVRRDVPNAAELDKTMIVTLRDDTAAVRAVNPGYLQFPTAFHSIAISGGVKAGGLGGTWTLTFNPGELSKSVYITIPNATLLNPSALYGLGFTVLTANAGGKISTQKSLVVEIGAKNAYDGIYAVTGPMVELTGQPWYQWNNPAISGFPAANGGAWEAHLVTSGGSTCFLVDQTIWGCCGHPMLNGSANSGFGSYGLVVNFNPATNVVSRVHNYYGDPSYGAATSLGSPAAGSGAPLFSASNTRRAELDPSGINAVQGNKDILIKYFMVQSSVVPVGPRITFDEKWKYLGPR